MIKTVGIDQNWFEKCTIEDIYKYFENKRFVQVDSETTGLHFLNDEFFCFQVGNKDCQFVISPEYIKDLKLLLESKILILHNAKFDLKFLYKKERIFPNRVYDTMLAEKVLTNGKLDEYYTPIRVSLKEVTQRYCNKERDKSIRENISKRGFTKEVIEYSAEDVEDLEYIMKQQVREAQQQGCVAALQLENRFVKVLAYVEVCGIKLSKKKWKEKMQNDLLSQERYKEQLDEYVRKHNPEYISPVIDLFSGYQGINISWDSPKQVIEYFKKLGINTQVEEKGVTKDSVEGPVLKKQQDDFEIIPIYLAYKGAQKVVSTYGKSWLDNIEGKTGRIHSTFQQLMDTSRLSCGARAKYDTDNLGRKYLAMKEQKNLQNLPANSATRGAFVPEDDNIMCSCDYSAQESVILANRSEEPFMVDFMLNDPSGDLHSWVAKMVFVNDIPRDTSLDDVKKKYKGIRQLAKACEFSIAYGGTGHTIAQNANIPIDEGMEAERQYYEAFPEMKNYFDKMKKFALSNGYVIISDITGRRYHFGRFKEYLQLKSIINKEFWETRKYLKEHDPDSEALHSMNRKMREYFNVKGEIERVALNYPIQSSSAETLKAGMVLFFDWIKENNYTDKVLIVNLVHDEAIIEFPKELLGIADVKLRECMIEGAKPYCNLVPLGAVGESGDHWIH